MFRGLYFIVITLFAMATNANGQPTSRRGDAVTGKLAAPSLEEHANYFSPNRKDISKESLAKADALSRKTIDSIEQLLSSKKKSVRRFELILRLGELHAERHDYLRDTEMTSYITAHDKWESTEKAKRGKEPSPNYSGSTSELTRAANSFRQLVNEFPKHPRTDAALYSLAKTLARLGKDTSVNYYKQLIKSFPKSSLLPDAYLALGEYYFEKQQVEEALTYYKKVMAFKTNRVYPYAIYKLGWAFYNSNAKDEKAFAANYKKAVTAFKLVVKLADKAKKQGQSSNLDLREEAIKDLIMVWAEAEDIASAWRYFKTIGDQDSFYKMLERLGNIYYEQGKNDKAIVVFERLLRDAPTRENNPAVHAKLLELNDLTNDIPKIIAELKNMQKLYVGNSAWVSANKKDPKITEDAVSLVERNMHRYGAMFHQRGQKAKSSSYLKSAASVYSMYLESFASNVNSYDIRYYLAEILYDFKKYEAASEHYLIVAKQTKGGKYEKPAALNAVASINQLVTNTKFSKLPPPGQVPSPLDIPKTKKQLVAAIDQYVSILPQEKDGFPMRFTAAQVYFDYGSYPEAIRRFEAITKEIPETKQARASVKVILGFYADKEDWNKLIAWSRSFNKTPKLLDPELKTYVADLNRNAMFKRAFAYEKAKNFDQAARSFLDFQKEYPGDKNADRALYNASLNFYKTGKIEAAQAAGTTLVEKYPRSEALPDTLANLGSTYEGLARFDEAANTYKKIAISFPKDPRAPGALYNSAILYKGLKNIDAATAALKDFLRIYPSNKITPDATLELAALLEKKNDQAAAASVYSTFARNYSSDRERALFAAAKAATITASYLNKAQGQKEIDAVRKQLMAKNAPEAYEARRALAEAMFKRLESKFAEFQAMAVTDGSKIEKQVGEKQAKLEELAKGYESIIDLGSAEFAVASLYRLGESHENFSQALFKAPGPRGASQAELDRFKTELEKVAFPLKEEAYKFFETAYKRSREVQTFTVWTRRTYQKMVDLAPEKHPVVEEMSADPAYLSHDLQVSKETASLSGE